MNPKPKAILMFLLMLAITVAAYTVVCLAMARTLNAGAMALMTVFLGSSLLLGLWLQKRIRRRAIADHLRCGACGYNLTGHKAVIGESQVRCPECGEPLLEANVVREGQPHPEEMRRSRGRLTLVSAAIGLVSFCVMAAVMLTQGRRGGDFWVIVVAVLCMIFSLAVTYRKQCRDKR